jgi:hypothetical protein
LTPPQPLTPLPEQYGLQAICPGSGLIIPKTPLENLTWRKKLLRGADSSETTRRQLRAACDKSPLFWINAFCWTYRPKKVSEDGSEITLTDSATHVPFITWKVQDEAILTLQECIQKGKDALINKSRDMGASWLGVAVIQWFWQFRGNTSFLELSRKESLVDRRGSMDSLFEKHRYLLKWQPNWLQPREFRDTFMHLENRDNGSVIDGESTNENAGQAGRSTAVLLDEFARVPNGDRIDLATADTTACRIFNSTPGGPTSQFTKIYRSRRATIIEMPWWRHPEKGRNATQIVEAAGKTIWTSPWREQQKLRRSSRDISQNIDMEHGRVGDMVFDSDEVNKHRTLFARKPNLIGNIQFDYDCSDSVKKATLRSLLRGIEVENPVRFTQSGAFTPWRLWFTPIDGRPPQDDRYVFGVDISGGTGSSNSVCTVKSHRHGTITAKFWDAHTVPEAFAEQVAFTAAWFGGSKPPYIVFEKNGPGMQFGKKLIDLAYPALYYQKDIGSKGENVGSRWGWHSSNQRKELLVGQYREALKTGAIINPCVEALDEALDYMYDDVGRIVPGGSDADGAGARRTHGDHVIADALCVLGSGDLPATISEVPLKVPWGSFADRRRAGRFNRMTEKRAWSK